MTLILVDELASLTAYITNKDARRRIAAALSLLLSQGRAVGVLVGAAVQDPRKETVPFRDLFPLRIGLRMTEAGQVPLALGEAADALGARCEQIPRSLPGIGYVTIEGTAEPVRVRFSYISDTAIGGIVQTYAPGTPPAELRLVTPTDTPDVAA